MGFPSLNLFSPNSAVGQHTNALSSSNCASQSHNQSAIETFKDLNLLGVKFKQILLREEQQLKLTSTGKLLKRF
jgi:hypothetical protein